jgi:hypothetical protein
MHRRITYVPVSEFSIIRQLGGITIHNQALSELLASDVQPVAPKNMSEFREKLFGSFIAGKSAGGNL